jgi:hypothetical protein
VDLIFTADHEWRSSRAVIQGARCCIRHAHYRSQPFPIARSWISSASPSARESTEPPTS